MTHARASIRERVILSREDGEGSQMARLLYFEILRFVQDDTRAHRFGQARNST